MQKKTAQCSGGAGCQIEWSHRPPPAQMAHSLWLVSRHPPHVKHAVNANLKNRRISSAGCYDGCVYAVRADTGNISATYKTNGEVKASPLIIKCVVLLTAPRVSVCSPQFSNAVWVGSYDLHLYLLSMPSLVIKKRWNLQGAVYSSPCADHRNGCDYSCIVCA